MLSASWISREEGVEDKRELYCMACGMGREGGREGKEGRQGRKEGGEKRGREDEEVEREGGSENER